MIGTTIDIVLAVLLSFSAALGITVGLAGWLGRPLHAYERLLFVIASLGVAWPAMVADFSTNVLAARGVGYLILAALFIRLFLTRHSFPAESAPETSIQKSQQSIGDAS